MNKSLRSFSFPEYFHLTIVSFCTTNLNGWCGDVTDISSRLDPLVRKKKRLWYRSCCTGLRHCASSPRLYLPSLTVVVSTVYMLAMLLFWPMCLPCYLESSIHQYASGSGPPHLCTPTVPRSIAHFHHPPSHSCQLYPSLYVTVHSSWKCPSSTPVDVVFVGTAILVQHSTLSCAQESCGWTSIILALSSYSATCHAISLCTRWSQPLTLHRSDSFIWLLAVKIEPIDHMLLLLSMTHATRQMSTVRLHTPRVHTYLIFCLWGVQNAHTACPFWHRNECVRSCVRPLDAGGSHASGTRSSRQT